MTRSRKTIVGQRWEPGELFGSEVELIARYGVSRAVFREAVRLLETLTDLTQRQQQPVSDRSRRSLEEIHAAHVRIAEAIIARDGVLARHRMMTHLEDVSAAAARRPPARAPMPAGA